MLNASAGRPDQLLPWPEVSPFRVRGRFLIRPELVQRRASSLVSVEDGVAPHQKEPAVLFFARDLVHGGLLHRGEEDYLRTPLAGSHVAGSALHVPACRLNLVECPPPPALKAVP